MTVQELDVRPLAKADKHPRIFETFDALGVGESFVLVNNHDPRHLRDEFERDHPRGYRWEYLDKGRGEWRIRITRLSSTPLPRVLGNAHEVAAGEPDAAGAVWKLQMSERDLDSNVIRLRPDSAIDSHAGPDLDVMLVVVAGTGRITTELDVLDVRAGSLVWLPRRSRRAIGAGPDGLTYLTVHRRRPSVLLDITSRATG